MKKIMAVLSVIAFILSFFPLAFSQTTEEAEQAQRQLEKAKQLREKIETEPKKTEIEEQAPAAAVTPLEGESKVTIKAITVTGVTLLADKAISTIVKPYKGRKLTLRQMQEIADKITDAYRKKGYITSRAYLPPQKIESGMLEIRVLEGITGDTQIKGNRFFKKKLYKRQFPLKKGDPFDYEVVRRGLSRINQLPDRYAKAVLAPGKEPGTTDILIEAEDHLPIHATLDFDNYGSPYINYYRARTTLTHNNLLGYDDVLNFQYQLAEGENYRLLMLRYMLPITTDLKIGFFAADSKISLRKDFEDVNARGKSRLYSIYATQSLIMQENKLLSLSVGFDYKDNFNFQSNLETSRDRMRVLKSSLDLDLTDTRGRTLLGNEISYGIADIMAGLKKVDVHSSRTGAGGKFVKNDLYLLRLQRLPKGATFLWKNQAQLSPYILTSSEQFQLGGIVNVRGYPPAEVVGDRGYSSTAELSLPPYFVSRRMQAPFSKAKLYDALRIVTFYDWGTVRLQRTDGAQKNRTLRSAGCGIRLNLPEDFSLRVETSWAMDNRPSDGDNVRTLFEVSKTF